MTDCTSVVVPRAVAVVEADLTASNGVAHLVDGVLWSPRRGLPQLSVRSALVSVSEAVEKARMALSAGVWSNRSAEMQAVSGDAGAKMALEELAASARMNKALSLSSPAAALSHPWARHTYRWFGELCALASPSLQRQLDAGSGATVFAFTDAAFSLLSSRLRTVLLDPADPEWTQKHVDAVVAQHIVPGQYLYVSELRTSPTPLQVFGGFEAGPVVTRSLATWGAWTQVVVSESATGAFGASALVVDPDMETTTAVVHGIDAMLVPALHVAHLGAWQSNPAMDIVTGVVHTDSDMSVFRSLLASSPMAAAAMAQRAGTPAAPDSTIEGVAAPITLMVPGNLDLRRALSVDIPAAVRMLSTMRPSAGVMVNASDLYDAHFTALDAATLFFSVPNQLLTSPFPSTATRYASGFPHEDSRQTLTVQSEIGFDVVGVNVPEGSSGIPSAKAIDVQEGPIYPSDANSDQDKQGAIYSIRGWFLPDSSNAVVYGPTSNPYPETVLDALRAHPDLTQLASLLTDATGPPSVRAALSGASPTAPGSTASTDGGGFSTTLFAPSNTAWSRMPPSQRRLLSSPAGLSLLDRLLRAHILPDAFIPSDLVPPTLYDYDASSRRRLDSDGEKALFGGASAKKYSQSSASFSSTSKKSSASFLKGSVSRELMGSSLSSSMLNDGSASGVALAPLLSRSEGSARLRLERFVASDGSDMLVVNDGVVTKEDDEVMTLSGVMHVVDELLTPPGVLTSLPAPSTIAGSVLAASSGSALPAPTVVVGDAAGDVAARSTALRELVSRSPALRAALEGTGSTGEAVTYPLSLSALLGLGSSSSTSDPIPSSTARPSTMSSSASTGLASVAALTAPMSLVVPSGDAAGDALAMSPALPWLLRGRTIDDWAADSAFYEAAAAASTTVRLSSVMAPRGTRSASSGRSSSALFDPMEELGRGALSGEAEEETAATEVSGSIGRDLLFVSVGSLATPRVVATQQAASALPSSPPHLQRDTLATWAASAFVSSTAADNAPKLSLAYSASSPAQFAANTFDVHTANLAADGGIVHLADDAPLPLPPQWEQPTASIADLIESGLPAGSGSSSVFAQLVNSLGNQWASVLVPTRSTTRDLSKATGVTLLVPLDSGFASLSPGRLDALLTPSGSGQTGARLDVVLGHSVLPSAGSRYSDGLVRASGRSLGLFGRQEEEGDGDGDDGDNTDVAAALARGESLPVLGVATAAAVRGAASARLNFTTVVVPALSTALTALSAVPRQPSPAPSSTWGAAVTAAESKPAALVGGVMGERSLAVLSAPPAAVSALVPSGVTESVGLAAARVVGADVRAADGVVHWIDRPVLAPDVLEALPADVCEPVSANASSVCGTATDGGPVGICVAGGCVCPVGRGGSDCSATQSSGSCVNGIMDGSESGIDCGGSSNCGRCGEGLACDGSSDCGAGLSCVAVEGSSGSGKRCVRDALSRAGPFVDVTLTLQGVSSRAFSGISAVETRARAFAAASFAVPESDVRAAVGAWRFVAAAAQAARDANEIPSDMTDTAVRSAIQAATVLRTAVARAVSEASGVAWNAGEYDDRSYGCGLLSSSSPAYRNPSSSECESLSLVQLGPYTNVYFLDIASAPASPTMAATSLRLRVYLPLPSTVGVFVDPELVADAARSSLQSAVSNGALQASLQWSVPALASPAGMAAPPGPQNPDRARAYLTNFTPQAPLALRSLSASNYASGVSGGQPFPTQDDDDAPNTDDDDGDGPSKNKATPAADSGGAVAAVIIVLLVLVIGSLCAIYFRAGGSVAILRSNPRDFPNRISITVRRFLERSTRDAEHLSKKPTILEMGQAIDVPGSQDVNPIRRAEETGATTGPGSAQPLPPPRRGTGHVVNNPVRAAITSAESDTVFNPLQGADHFDDDDRDSYDY